MAAPWNPIKRGEDFQFPVTLKDYQNPGLTKANPTLAAGDVTISKDGGAFANLNTLPSVSPASGVQVIALCSATEMTADNVMVRFHDQTVPPEWEDLEVALIPQA